MAKTHFPTGQGANEWAAFLSHYLFGAPTGNVFFVHSGSGTDGAGYGRSPDSPFATLDYAIGQATANNGDHIFVMPGHAEVLASAAAVALDVAGLTIVGLGNGRNRPTFTMTATDNSPSFDISAANNVVANLVLINDDDAQTAMINVTAANVTIRDCELVVATSAKQAVIGILGTTAADRLTLERLHIHGSADAGCDHAISLGATDDVLIKDCIIIGAFAVGGAIENDAAAINFNVIGNFIVNQTADGNNKAIVLHSSTTGLIANNRGAIIDSSGPAPVTAAAAFVAHNYWSSAAGVTASVLM